MRAEKVILPKCPFGHGLCGMDCPNHPFAVAIERLNAMIPEDLRPQVEASRDRASLAITAEGMVVKLVECTP